MLLVVYWSDRYRRFEDKIYGEQEWLIIRTIYTYVAEGVENNNCERTHYARQGEQNVWHGHVCKSQEQQDGGGSAYIRKGSPFFIHTYKKKKKPNIYIVFVYVYSPTRWHGNIGFHTQGTLIKSFNEKYRVSDFYLRWISRNSYYEYYYNFLGNILWMYTVFLCLITRCIRDMPIYCTLKLQSKLNGSSIENSFF